MATNYSDLMTTQLPGAAAYTRAEGRNMNGRVRSITATYTVGASTLPIADVIQWFTLPKGCRLLGHLTKMYFSAGTASSTLNLGDSASAARYLAATSVASAGSAVCEAANASGVAGFVNTGDTVVQSVVAGAVLAIGQVITLHASYVQD